MMTMCWRKTAGFIIHLGSRAYGSNFFLQLQSSSIINHQPPPLMELNQMVIFLPKDPPKSETFLSSTPYNVSHPLAQPRPLPCSPRWLFVSLTWISFFLNFFLQALWLLRCVHIYFCHRLATDSVMLRVLTSSYSLKVFISKWIICKRKAVSYFFPA